MQRELTPTELEDWTIERIRVFGRANGNRRNAAVCSKCKKILSYHESSEFISMLINSNVLENFVEMHGCIVYLICPDCEDEQAS